MLDVRRLTGCGWPRASRNGFAPLIGVSVVVRVRRRAPSLRAVVFGVVMEEFKSARIAFVNGKLVVLLSGMGAVATTFIAGVKTAHRKLAKPIGSLTQLA